MNDRVPVEINLGQYDEHSTVETRRTHYYTMPGLAYALEGYGPSMDPHRCGDPEEPCILIIEEREVGPWTEVQRIRKP